MHTVELVLLLVLLLALIVCGVLVVRRLRARGEGRSWPLALIPVLALVAVGVVAGLVTIQGVARSESPQSLQRAIIDDLQRYYYKPVDGAKLARVGDRSGIRSMLKTLNDPYTEYLDARQFAMLRKSLYDPTYGGIGAILDATSSAVSVVRVIADSPAAAAGLLPGDVISSVNGKPTSGEPLGVVSARIRGKAGTRVRLVIHRPGTAAALPVTLTRAEVQLPLATSRLIKHRGLKVGYVYLSSFSKGATGEVRAALQDLQKRGAQRIILDLRDNGGGLLGEGIGVASDFLRPGLVVVTTQGMHSPKEVSTSYAGPATSLPLVVLVNHYSASDSEIVSGALQDWGRATIIGTRTYGKGLVQYTFAQPGGGSLKLTIAVYLTPRGKDINHVGIIPSIKVSDDLKTKPDEALDRALQYLATGR